MKIVGVRSVSFTGADGNKVEGTQLFTEEPLERDGAGVQCEKLWLKPSVYADLVSSSGLASGGEMLGRKCEVSYNRYGKVAAVRLVK